MQPLPTMLPVTVLTGFLGAGKTTLLQRVLTEQHGQKIAVIENEFGAESIDNELLTQLAGEQLVEMNNGCICCTVRGDLTRILRELHDKRVAGVIKFDRVIIETTGMANPGPVAQTFFMDDFVAENYLLDAVITVVDAKHGMQTLDEQDEAQSQVAFADRLLVSKRDLVTDGEFAALKTRLARMNPRAPITPVDFGKVDIKDVLDIKGFNLSAVLDISPEFLISDAHTHDDAVKSFVFTTERLLDGTKFEEFMSAITQVYGEDMLRYKGILALHGMERRMVFQGVHMMMGADAGKPWAKGEKRSSKMVFIGRKLPEKTIIEGLKQCLR
jgi:G3E family GTPase